MMANSKDARHKQLLNMMNELKDESDRAVAVLVGAFLDELLKDLIVATARTDPDEIENLLFRNLGSFGSRIEGTHELKLLTQDECHDLRRVKEVRNIFAHEFVGVTFETPKVNELCQKLKTAKIGGQPPTARECFTKSAVRLMVAIYTQSQNKVSP